MNEEKYDAFVNGLKEKHPHSFNNVYCGISIGEGWYKIIQSLSANIDHHIKWKRKQRAQQLVMNRAILRGREAVLKRLANGKNVTHWDEDRADEIIANGMIEPPAKVNWVEVHQIKEKFGGLRFYYDGGDDEVSGMVRMAEAWADSTCETCGDRGERRHGGWIRTLCDKHEAEYQARQKEYE